MLVDVVYDWRDGGRRHPVPLHLEAILLVEPGDSVLGVLEADGPVETEQLPPDMTVPLSDRRFRDLALAVQVLHERLAEHDLGQVGSEVVVPETG